LLAELRVAELGVAELTGAAEPVAEPERDVGRSWPGRARKGFRVSPHGFAIAFVGTRDELGELRRLLLVPADALQLFDAALGCDRDTGVGQLAEDAFVQRERACRIEEAVFAGATSARARSR
jgi:hypothetical protein